VSKKKGFDPSQISFSVIKQRGDPKHAMTMEGHRVEKQEFVFVENPLNPDPEAMKSDIIPVRCMDYHNEHFVYLDPVNKKGRWFAWCTCGSPAVIIYDQAALAGRSTKSMALICFFHGQFGRHVTSETNKRFDG